MADAWEEALKELPIELAKTVLADGYESAVVFTRCFRTEEQLDKYARGLLLVQKVINVEGLTEDNVMFSPCVGELRGLREAALSQVAEELNARNSARQAACCLR